MRGMSDDDDPWFMRPWLVVGAGGVAVSVAIALAIIGPRREDVRTPAVISSPTASLPSGPPSEATVSEAFAAAVLPSFDIVRVERDGDAVIAGRGPSRSQIWIKSGENVIGSTIADDRGNWVLVPDRPLTSGTHRLTLEAQREGGKRELSDEEVVIVIPSETVISAPADAAATLPGQPLAVKTSRSGTGPSVVLQSSHEMASGQSLGILTIDEGAGRGLTIGGRSVPGAILRLYLDQQVIGEAQADGLGLWRLRAAVPLPPGRHTLRADQIDKSGTVLARVAVVVDLGQKAAPSDGQVTVERGQSLWRIARDVYGRGTAFVLIYDANRQHIEDPDRIYPGQVFQLPKHR